MLNQYIRYLRSHGVGIAVTASTGIAATHLHGRTIHSWSGLGVRDALSPTDLRAMQRDKRLRKNYKQSKVLVIDEVSMLHPYQLDLVDSIARHMLDPLQPFGGLQVILSGDFFQLPPVAPGNGARQFAYEADAWTTGGFVSCYLSENHRQGDDPLITVLNEIRAGIAGEQTRVPLRTRYKQNLTAVFARLSCMPEISTLTVSTVMNLRHLMAKSVYIEWSPQGSEPWLIA